MFGERRSAHILLTVVCLGATMAVGGCGNKMELAPVSGKVTVGDKPLMVGMVRYVADPSQGNQAKVTPSGMVGADGSYELATNGKPGAPAGWYRVVVITKVPGMAPSAEGKEEPSVDAKYAKQDTTPLSIEVKPGAPAHAYDLRLEP